MFINIDGINYFILPEGKSINEIYYEIFSRMTEKKIDEKRKREIIYQIKKQTKKQTK